MKHYVVVERTDKHGSPDGTPRLQAVTGKGDGLDLAWFAARAVTLYGLAEIAAALGVKVEKVRDWREAGHLPEPTAKLRAGYVWAAEDIEWWIREHRAEGEQG